MLVRNETTAQHCTQSTTLFDKLTNTGLFYRQAQTPWGRSPHCQREGKSHPMLIAHF